MLEVESFEGAVVGFPSLVANEERRWARRVRKFSLDRKRSSELEGPSTPGIERAERTAMWASREGRPEAMKERLK